ncbi:hypothetical protein GTO89_00465 [Heliobacterium gestii]|uniref:Uncharacterized protein n=1 Tax=Heliomicrobium gestii TaxID=2699 RepID=A0A845LAE8_HELGE|nr:hypothetical protein [Heliomicrobium gestii]MBM7865240.1 hypothetical protein [Heliomicrobium gestii]MZP41505.1 hypothetical protein [Heliomicrobium gestii]
MEETTKEQAGKTAKGISAEAADEAKETTEASTETSIETQKAGLTVDLMRKIIEEKKQKSASQGHRKKGKQEGGPVSARPGIKKYKKGGLFDK